MPSTVSDKKELFLDEDELSQSKSQEIRIKDLIGKISTEYDFDAIYQRSSHVWPVKMKENLMTAIVSGMPIGYIHVITDADKFDTYIVCDGKQRMECISAFINNDFPMQWKGSQLFFEDLKSVEHKVLYDRIMNYTLNFRLWPPMSVLKQRDLFERINSSSNLNKNERLYCSNFLTKVILTYIYNKCFNSIKKYWTQPTLDNKRYTGLRWSHDLMILCFGINFDSDKYGVPSTEKKVKESCRKIETRAMDWCQKEKILCDIINFDETAIDKMFNDFGISKNIKLLKDVVSAFGDAISFSTQIKQKTDRNCLIDLIYFFVDEVRRHNISLPQMRQYKKEISELVRKYEENRSSEGLTDHQSSLGTLDKKMSYLKGLLEEYDCIDFGKKSRNITNDEKRVAEIKANGICALCECELTKENIQYDHVYPISLNTKSDIRALCKYCNNKKSNLTPQYIDKLSDYMKTSTYTECKSVNMELQNNC